MKKRYGSMLTIVGLIMVICTVGVHTVQLWRDFYYPPRKEILNEMAYFPSGKFLRIVVCDFDIFFSNIVWLRALQYYGQHALTDCHYPWLYHIFDILTQLDPLFINGYRFGGVLISQDGGRPKDAINLLKRAVGYCPERWEPLFDIAFIYYTIIKDYDKSARYFKLASVNEGHKGRSIRFAAHAFRKAKKYEFAKRLWEVVLRTAQSDKRKETARRSMCYIKIDEDIDTLQKLVNHYQRKFGRYPVNLLALIEGGLATKLPKEPFGGEYIISDAGLVRSTTLLYDELELKVKFINQRLTAYKIAKGEFPENLNDLVTEGFIAEIPTNPFGLEYLYDRSQGKVLLPNKLLQ